MIICKPGIYDRRIFQVDRKRILTMKKEEMAEDYDVDPVYVLDMYRYGKASWMIDVLLRLAVCVAVAVIVWGIKKAFKMQIPHS